MQVWEDLLGFDGCEFYFKHWPELTGCTFGEVLLRFADAVPCGVRMAAKGGQININPPDSYVMQAGDEVLVIAEDDDSYEPGPPNKASLLQGLFRLVPVFYRSCFALGTHYVKKSDPTLSAGFCLLEGGSNCGRWGNS